MLTLNQIVSQITNLAAAHNQIAESGVGDFAEWQAKERSYPILWVFHESTSVNQMEIAFSIRLICADRVIVGEEGDNTEGHEQEVISDTLLVLLDFLAYFQQNHSQPYNVVTSATIDPFTERLNDRLAGNSVTIQIRQPFDWNKCQIPQSGASIPPSVDGLTLYDFCDPSVVARLTDAQRICLEDAICPIPTPVAIRSAIDLPTFTVWVGWGLIEDTNQTPITIKRGITDPVTGLVTEAEAFGPLIQRIKRDLDASVVVIEHDMPMIMSISDRIYCMEAGTVIAEGDPETVRSDPRVIASYLGTDERAIERSQHSERQTAP